MNLQNGGLMSEQKVCIIGGGFIGKPLAERLKSLGYHVTVMLSSEKRREEFINLEIPTRIAKVGSDAILTNSDKPKILVLAYPIGARKIENNEHLQQVQWIAKAFPAESLTQVILTSSTSVYPDGLGIVDESCMVRPTDHGLIQLEYEEALHEIYGEKLTIFRLAGLMGASRNPGKFLAGRVNLPNPDSPVNMVHQTDVVRFIEEAILKEVQGEVFNLCHDEHPSRADYYTTTAQALGLEAPTFSREQINHAKLVSNQKAKDFFQLDYFEEIW